VKGGALQSQRRITVAYKAKAEQENQLEKERKKSEKG
jgi:hypothetical protein